MALEQQFHNSLSVHSGWQSLLALAAKELNVESQPILSKRKNSEGRLHFHDLREELVKLCECTDDELVPVRAAKHVTPLTFGSYSLVLWTAPDIETLLKTAAEFSIVVASPIRLQYRESKQGNAELWILDNEPYNQESHVTYLGITMLIATFIFILKHVINFEDIDINVKLIEHNFCAEKTEQLEQLTGAKVTAGHPIRKISIDKKHLHKPLDSYDEGVYFSVLNLLRKDAESLKRGDLILQIYNVLNQTQSLESISGESLAQSLNMNIRTLNRRLSELNTSYRGVVEKYKLEKALHLLEDQHISMTEIAYQLGFADLSTFSRAFKRWTGLSPIKLRRNQTIA
ncbi:AraC family transcriptional regulator [Vibrio sp. Isolate34]|uniref:helix-turn-helix domain-containing protein n=1 Tax=Vibrio sp. Isolate34 TaxID=2908540 RepID=UPI001EFD8895|nr:AraC family transcriptional regulator [Vibrio sp. Isolate34]MCG9640542.1 AraC family transcriptional regulator [Vibrio sp. Isolate34]